MDETCIESDEPIFELASECESLFSEHISKLKDKADLNGAKVVSEYQQRFSAWAAFLGVFAVPEMCLDRRLQRHAEVQDLVLRLLDIIKRNLTHLFEPDNNAGRGDSEILDSDRAPSSQLHISVESLRGVEGAIERLNHLGGTIQQSSETSHAIRFGKFATSFDSSSFEEVAQLAINSFYPYTSPSLLEHLARAMIDMYGRFQYRRSRQVRLQARPRLLLSTIDEEPTSKTKIDSRRVSPPPIPATPKQLYKQLSRPFSKIRLDDMSHKSKESKPTSLDSQEFRKLFPQHKDGSKKSNTRSILISQISYPQPSGDTLACEWCFSPLPEDEFKGEKWKKHLNEDFKPFFCISEKCREPLKRFATSRAWYNHMLEAHGQNWHREVHLPAWWICPLCNTQDATYSRAQDLSEHISKLHGDIFTGPQIQTITHQSQLRSPRPQDICPLCCFSMKDGQERETEGQISSNETPSFSTNEHSEPSGRHKRIKTETGPVQLSQHGNVGSERVAAGSQIQSPQSQHPLNIEAIANHVAAHMQGIMLLALRMMSLDVAPDMPSDGEVLYGSTDYDLSRDNSNQYCEKEDEIGDGLSTQEEDSMGLDDPLLEDRVPDCGHYIDWQDTVLNNQPVAKADPFLQGIIDSGAFRTKPIENRLRPGTIILFPYRHDPDFVGRESLLHNLTRQCSAPPSRVAIVGLGGMGKSWLAIELAYQIVRLAKSSVFWIHADTLARVEEGFRKIATQVRPSSRNLSNSDLVQLAYNWLSDERNGRWVMILDGADEEEILRRGYDDSPERESLAAYLPQSPNGSIIITTRNRSIGSWLTRNRQDVVEVGPMAVSEALFLLEKKLGQLPNRDAATSLVRSIGLIPLAITQAAAYMQSLPQSWPNKHLHDLQDSQEEKLKLLDFEIGGLHRDADAPNSIFATWKKSFDSVRLRRPSAANLMSLMSFFDRRGIPKRLIKPFKRDDDAPWKYGPSKKEDQAPGSGDFDSDTNADSIFNDDIEMLINNHLVKANGKRDIFEMHGLVQLSVRKDLDVLMKQAFEQQFVKRLAAEFPTSTYSNWETCEELLAHVQVAASYQPSHHVLAEWATLLYNGGRYARLQGNYEVAKQMANKSSVARKDIGGDDLSYLTSLSLTALILLDQGLYGKAEELFIQIADTCQTKGLGDDHPYTLTSLSNLASIYRIQGRQEEAERLHIQAMQARTETLGPTHPRTLTSTANMASMFRAQGQWAKAELLHGRVTTWRKKRLGMHHPHTLTSMSNLASMYRLLGRLDEADSLQVNALKHRKLRFGADHPETLTSMNCLASIYRTQGRLEEAERLQVQVMEVRTTKLGKDHPNTLASMNNLALIYNDQEKHYEAGYLQSKVVEICKTKFGSDHPHTLTSLNNLAIIWKCLDRHTEAMALMKNCVEARQRVLGPDHPYTLSSKVLANRWTEEMVFP